MTCPLANASRTDFGANRIVTGAKLASATSRMRSVVVCSSKRGIHRVRLQHTSAPETTTRSHRNGRVEIGGDEVLRRSRGNGKTRGPEKRTGIVLVNETRADRWAGCDQSHGTVMGGGQVSQNALSRESEVRPE